MNVLMLGATGYLGGNIVSHLVDQGHNVLCTVRTTSNYQKVLSKGVELISNNLDQIEITMREKQIDWVINSICTYRPNESLYGDMLESNVMFPLGVLNLAIKYHIKNYMTMGTGLPKDLNVYSFTKNQFSEFGKFLSINNNINFYNLKLEMFFGGDGEPDSRFLKHVKTRLIANEPLELTEGYQKRDLIRVEDILQIISMIMNDRSLEGFYDFPVGYGEQHSIREIVIHMKECLGSDSDLRFGAVLSRKGEPDTCADISSLSRLGFKSNFSYWESIEDYCKMS